jgi:hypothetical protein
VSAKAALAAAAGTATLPYLAFLHCRCVSKDASAPAAVAALLLLLPVAGGVLRVLLLPLTMLLPAPVVEPVLKALLLVLWVPLLLLLLAGCVFSAAAARRDIAAMLLAGTCARTFRTATQPSQTCSIVMASMSAQLTPRPCCCCCCVGWMSAASTGLAAAMAARKPADMQV